MAPVKRRIIELRHYSLPIHFPVLLLSGDRWRISDIKSDRLHFHNCLEIGICHSSGGQIQIEGQTLPFKAGDVTCIPRHVPHTTYSMKDNPSLWSFMFWDPDCLFKNQFRSSGTNLEKPTAKPNVSHYIYPKEKFPRVHRLATAVLDELNRKDCYYEESAKGLLFALYVELIRINSDTSGAQEPITESNREDLLTIMPALNHIYKNYMTPIRVNDLAELCYLSPSHFRRIFHETMGTSPALFIRSTCIEEACKLLQATDDSILSISEQVGFRSISSFNRCFAKLLGDSPREWRKKALKNQALEAKASILEFQGWM